MIALTRILAGWREAVAGRPRARRVAKTSWLAAAVAAFAALAMPAISLAGNVYWSAGEAGELRLGSSSGGLASTLFSEEHEPGEIAIDTASGAVYWTEAETGAIRVGSLEGGTPQTLYSEPGARPAGIAINAAAGQLYWVDEATRQIRVGSLAGGTPQTLFTEPEGSRPVGLALTASAGRLYWTDAVSEAGGPGTIRSGATSGGAAQTLYTEPEGAEPVGIAIDSATSTLYWTDEGADTVREGPLRGAPGGASAKTLYQEAAGSRPRGIAVDAGSGELYWSNAGSGTIQFGPIAGSAAPGSLFAGEAQPAFATLLLAPSGTGVPKISGNQEVGSTLTCGNGSWSSNLPGANLYAAPTSYAYQWQDGGVAIAGATAAAYVAGSEGTYSCAVSASNAAGSTTQTSVAETVKAQAPTASISYPVSGATFEQGAAVATSFACAEGAGGPGLASCTDGKGTSQPTGKLNTGTLGSHTYVVTAVSKDGQRATASVTVTIVAKAVAPPPPKAKRKPTITLASSKATVKSRRTTIALVCHAQRCAGKLSLTATLKLPGARRKSEVLFVRVSYSLAAGKRKSIPLRLSPQAKKLLADAQGRRLSVRARATVSGGATKHRAVLLHLLRPS